MPIQGFTRLRKHQFGLQSAFGTPHAATRAYPFKGIPTVNLNWTDPDVDAGALDIVAPPYRTAPDITAPLTDPALAYPNIPLLLAGMFGGGVTPTGAGTAKTWAWTPGSTTPDDYDPLTYEFGDDVLGDWFQLSDGYLASLEVTGPDGLGPVSTSMGWNFGSAASTGSTDSPVTGTVPTPALSVSTTDPIVYLKDAALYIASTVAGLAAGQVSDALHSFVLRVNEAADEKRFANGTGSFAVQALGRGPRTIELDLVFAKTADTVGTGSEADAWFSDDAVNRFVRVAFESQVVAEAGSPDVVHSWDFILPLRYYTRADGDIAGNSTVTLTGHGFYDPADLAAPFKSTVVTTLAAL